MFATLKQFEAVGRREHLVDVFGVVGPVGCDVQGAARDEPIGNQLDEAIRNLRRTVPENGTNIKAAFEVINQLNPAPDNVLLLVDSLPTTDQLEPARGMVTGAERLRFHYDAIDVIPSGVPINVLLYPMEGDYQASIAYWLLAYGTGGSYMSISKDWP